jgi:hypothetical protein
VIGLADGTRGHGWLLAGQLHQAGEECAGGDRLAKGDEEVNRTGGEEKSKKRGKEGRKKSLTQSALRTRSTQRRENQEGKTKKGKPRRENQGGPPWKDGPYNGKKYKDGAI